MMKSRVKCPQCDREYRLDQRHGLRLVGGGTGGVTIDGVEYETFADEKRECPCGTVLVFVTRESPEA